MKSEFVPYDLSLRMKQLGFNEPCFGYYKAEYEDGINPLPVNLILEQNKASSNVFYKTSAPTFQQAFRWFRAKYSICVEIHETTDWEEDNESWSFVIFKYRLGDNDGMISSTIDYDTYEDAELDCLKKLIEIVENEKML